MSIINVPLNDYLKRHYIEKGVPHTHTRIGDKENKISGGSYSILDDEEFLKIYYENVFVKGNKEFLTEKTIN